MTVPGNVHRYSYGNIVGHGERGAQRSGLGEEIHRHVPLQMEGRNVDVSTVSVQGGNKGGPGPPLIS